jgi:hypothetical protein
MHDWSNAATLVIAVAAVHQYALDAAHQSSQKLCEHHLIHDWSSEQLLWLL